MPWFNFSFHDFAVSFLSVLFEGIPFLLLGSLISGFVEVFVSSERVSKLLPKQPGAAIFLGGLLGLVFPMCECGSVVIIRRFLKKGLPLSCATAYMLGAPIVSPIVALSTWSAFSQSTQTDPIVMVSLRLGMGYLIAVGLGFLVHRLPAHLILRPGTLSGTGKKNREGLSIGAAPSAAGFAEERQDASLRRKLLMAVQSATADFLDVAFFFIVGTALTCLFNTGIRQDILSPLASEPLLGIFTLMFLAGLLGLCSSTDAFVAWTFTAFAPSAKLAFLVFGPMFDLKLFWLYGLIFRRRAVVSLGVLLFVVIAWLCWRLDSMRILG
jgi:uncharacterized membrane protein YraQ (UPF0718 family)